MNGGSSRSSSRFPFTPSQWQELEHQALIYKYMASGISIPPDLLFSIKRGYHLDHSRLFPHHHPPQHLGWNYLQMGLGRKIDPEPGRCRRTDGKKWRCSKEAYPDSKYCERHMHRGKNRSRKPVEQTLKQSPAPPTNTDDAAAASPAPSSTTTTILSITNNNNNNSLSPLSSAPLSSHDIYHQQHQHQHSFLYHHHQQPSSRSSNSIGFSFQDNNNAAPLFLDTTGSSSHTNTDCRERYIYGLKEEVDEHAFFTEPSGTMRSFSASSMDDSWQLTPLTISSSSSSSSKQRSCLSNENNNNEYSYLQLHHHHSFNNNNNNSSKQREAAEQDHGCYMALGGKEEEAHHHEKTTVHRFFDEWPHKSRGGSSWLDLDDKSSTTQLSISIPASSHHDFTTFTSRNHTDG